MRVKPGQVLSVCKPVWLNIDAQRAVSDHCFNVAIVRLHLWPQLCKQAMPGVSAKSNQILQPFCSPSH